MLKLDFSQFEQTPQLGLARTWDGVCLNIVGCTRYFVGLILTFEPTPFYLLSVPTNPTWMYFEKVYT